MIGSSRDLKAELGSIQVIENLTDVFENTASIKIRAVRQQVLSSKLFFNDLWNIYQQIRISQDIPKDALTGSLDKHLLLFIASPVGLAGPSDAQIFQQLGADYKPGETDILVIGSHGNFLLGEYKLKPVAAFEMPDTTKDFTVDPILSIVRQYKKTTAYYNSYVSLTTQRPAKLQLLLEAQKLSDEERALMEGGETEVISTENYIFEPSITHIVEYLGQIMLNTTLTQLLLESQLAQQASRFTNMTLAHDRAKKLYLKTFLDLQKVKRSERDEMTRQIVTAARMI